MSAKSIEGPIGIARLSGDAAREGPTAFVGLMAMVSLNLAVFNLLPIPILDGGLILLLLIEMVMRRDMSMQVKEAVFKVGMVFLMVVVVSCCTTIFRSCSRADRRARRRTVMPVPQALAARYNVDGDSWPLTKWKS